MRGRRPCTGSTATPTWLGRGSPEEIDEEHFPITRQVSIPVRAWIRFHADALIQPDCVVIAFNSKAVQISFRNRQGQEITTWVYASAVERRDVRDR